VNVKFKRSFIKDLKGIKDQRLTARVRETIEIVEQAQNLLEIGGMKKLSGGSHYYRIRIGDYRLGLTVENDTVTFVRFLHRRDIYTYFP